MKKQWRLPSIAGVARSLALLTLVILPAQMLSSQPILDSISINPPSPIKIVGEQPQFTAIGTFSDSSSRELGGGKGTWMTKTPMTTASFGLGATFLNGKLYAISGDPTTRVTTYDPESDTWNANAPLPELRLYFGTAVANGKIYVIGGTSSDNNPTNTLYIYDPANDAWSMGAPLSQGARFYLGAATINGKIYAVGGYGNNPVAILEVYDPTNDTWTQKASMFHARVNPGVGVINGLLYVAGGSDNLGALDSMEIYDPLTDAWTNGTAMPTARGGPAAVLDGKLYLVGGGPSPKDYVDVFDPIVNAWYSETPLSVGREDLGLAADESAHKLYAVGGINRVYFRTLEVLTPPEITWHSSTPAVATIDSNGLATAIAEGSATITASSGSVAGNTTLNVSPSSPCVLQFDASAYTVSEGIGLAPFNVIRIGGSQGEVSVHFSTSAGTAASGVDYAETSGPLTFANGETNVTFSFPILDNAVLGGSKTVNLTLSNPSGTATLGSPSNAVLTILDNEIAAAGKFQFSAPTFTVSEAGPTASVIVTRTGGSVGAVTVNFSTSDGTATSGADYTTVSSNLTFAAGVLSRTVTIPIVNDTLDETNETVLLTLTHPTGGASLGLVSTAVLTITDNDVAGAVQFSAAAYSVSETGQVARVVVTRTGGTASGVTVELAVTGGNATAGEDYTFVDSVLTFAANELSKTNSISIMNDLLAEGNETVNLTLRNIMGGATLGPITNAVLTILDDEVSLQFSKAIYTNSEAGPLATITVSRAGPANKAVSVNFATIDGGTATLGTDYLATNGTLSLPAGAMSKSFSVRIVNDTVVEPDETVFLQLSSPSNALLAPLSQATLLITNNDFGGVINFSATNYTVSEAGPVATIIVARTGGVASGVTVDFTTADDTATAGADYTMVSSNLTFAAGELKKTLTVPILNDGIAEGNEKFKLVLSNPTGGASLGTRATATVTITDNDVAGVVQFSAAGYSISENGTNAVILITRAGGAASNVTVNFSTLDDTATSGQDYTEVVANVNFGAGELNKTVLIPITQDTQAEGNERVQLRLRDVAGGGRLGAISNAVLTILDDESSFSFTNTVYEFSEASTAAIVTVVRNGFAGTAATVNYSTAPGTAEAGTDYVTTNGTLTFGPGVTSRTISIKLLNDTLDETNETFEVSLTGPTGGAQLTSSDHTTVRIIDDDSGGTIQFSAPNYSVVEGTPNASVLVERAGGLASGVTVHFETSDGTANAGLDYTGLSTNLTFNAGELSKTVLVPILTDALVETNETVSLTLSNPTGGASLGVTNTATLRIVNKP